MTDATTPWLALAVAVVLNAAANVLIKTGTPRLGAIEPQTLVELAGSPYVLAGIASFAGALAFYALALTHVELSIAYPIMTSLGIALVFLWSVTVLHERLDWTKIAGTALVLVGVTLLYQGG